MVPSHSQPQRGTNGWKSGVGQTALPLVSLNTHHGHMGDREDFSWEGSEEQWEDSARSPQSPESGRELEQTLGLQEA
jgi:hypothetical protein